MNLFGNLHTVVSADRIANLIKYSEMVKDMEGSVAEIGVFMGGTLEILAKFNSDKTVYGIDSFCGVPAPTEKDNYHQEGDFSDGVEYEAIYGYFKTMHRNVELVKGFAPEVFRELNPYTKFRLVHIDVDLYNSVRVSLDYFYPRMVDGGVIILDDYGFESTEGAKIATDEFAEKINPTYKGELMYYPGKSNKQFLIIK